MSNVELRMSNNRQAYFRLPIFDFRVKNLSCKVICFDALQFIRKWKFENRKFLLGGS